MVFFVSAALLFSCCTSQEEKAVVSTTPSTEKEIVSTSLAASTSVAPTSSEAVATSAPKATTTLPATPVKEDRTVARAKSSDIQGKTPAEINKLFIRAEGCSGCDFNPSRGIVSKTSKYFDITEAISATDNKGDTISEAAPTQVTAVYLTNAGSRLRIAGRSDAHFEQEMCLYIRADDNGDGIYERAAAEKCWGKVPYPSPFDITLDIGNSTNLLFHSKGSISIDSISPDGMIIE